jgi:hypothetical protein
MIDLKTFKKELEETVSVADEKDGSGPDVHAEILEMLLLDIKESWDKPNEALEEITFVLNKVFPRSLL